MKEINFSSLSNQEIVFLAQRSTSQQNVETVTKTKNKQQNKTCTHTRLYSFATISRKKYITHLNTNQAASI